MKIKIGNWETKNDNCQQSLIIQILTINNHLKFKKVDLIFRSLFKLLIDYSYSDHWLFTH